MPPEGGTAPLVILLFLPSLSPMCWTLLNINKGVFKQMYRWEAGGEILWTQNGIKYLFQTSADNYTSLLQCFCLMCSEREKEEASIRDSRHRLYMIPQIPTWGRHRAQWKSVKHAAISFLQDINTCISVYHRPRTSTSEIIHFLWAPSRSPPLLYCSSLMCDGVHPLNVSVLTHDWHRNTPPSSPPSTTTTTTTRRRWAVPSRK